ncbi:TRAP transporter large permease (plasmid) [Pseudohalocynthiibacter aestuariivivens]|nr:TRAP transporter large permease [Pseudohalocynthiibacter aestuariivivens]QIE48024.1 TRAP transporter large permease [Pseudohalocynthiibacter aestuariivivens]
MSVEFILLLTGLLGLIALGVPIAFAVGTAVCIYALTVGFPPLSILAQQTVRGVDSFVLLALPLFIWGGILMEKGGATDGLMKLVIATLGRLPGGSAVASVVATTFFGALSGSAVAATVAVGQLMQPRLVQQGYAPGFVVSMQACSGALGAVIPPGISMVAYGAISGTSIRDLFAGAVLPGLLAGFLLCLVAVLVSHRRGYKETLDVSDMAGPSRLLGEAMPALFMPIIVLGGVFLGIFTATEAAAVACIYALFIGIFIYRKLTPTVIWDSLVKATRDTAAITIIIAVSSAFGWIIAAEQVPQAFASWITSVSADPLVILLLMSLLLFILGTFMETISIIVILTPIFVPVAVSAGIDPLHFGVLMILNLAIGGVTPPLGVCLFAAARILHLDISQTFRELVFPLGALLLAFGLTMAIPELVTWVK